MHSGKNGGIALQQELENCILHGLGCEWENALWVLTPSQRRLIRRPLISLKDFKAKLGSWNGTKHEISLSRHLVLNYSWDAVREVLLHEMAHQFAEEILGALDDPAHGPTFQRACHLLRANPKASGSYRPLRERVFQDGRGSEDKILLRVRKLMALAESQNRHEAEAAMSKAHELIAKYNIDLVRHDRNRAFVSAFVGMPALRHSREEYYLARLLQDFYFVYGLWVSAYVLDKGKMGHVLEITGAVQNIRIAGYVYDFVRHYIETQWNDYNMDKGLNCHHKTDFAVGIIEGFRSRLNSQDEEKKPVKEALALAKIQDPALKEYVAYKYPHTIVLRRKTSGHNEKVLRDGISAGKKLIISEGITERTSHGVRYLYYRPF